MERPPKQGRFSFTDSYRPQSISSHEHVGSGFTEEEFCDLFREASSESRKGPFLNWLSSYVGSPAVGTLSLNTLRLVHGWLVLQLGSSFNDTSIGSSSATRLILNCLRHIYVSHSITVLLNPPALSEALKAHMRQAIKITRTDVSDEERLSTLSLCLVSIDLMLRAQMERYGEIAMESVSPDDDFKDFLLALLVIRRTENQYRVPSMSSTAYQLILKLSHTNALSFQDEETFHNWAQIARLFVQDDVNQNNGTYAVPRTARANPRYQTEAEWVFHIECLVHFGNVLLRDTDESDQDELARIALNDHAPGLLSLRAARCLSQLSTMSSSCSESLFQKVVQMFIVSNHQIKIQMLPALRGNSIPDHLCEGFSRFVLSDERTLKAVLSGVVDLVLSAHETENLLDRGVHWREDAARFLHIVLLHLSRDSSMLIPHMDILSISFAFLNSPHPEAVKCAVDTLFDTVLHGTFPIPDVADLFQSLITPLLSLSGDMETKEKAMDLLVLLTRQRPMHLSQLVRIPRALEGLVRCASVRQTHAWSSKRLKNRATSVLLRMAEDPINHRVLAKQTGLLSLLIRYIREEESFVDASVPEEDDEDMRPVVVPNREAIKASILRIAAAL